MNSWPDYEPRHSDWSQPEDFDPDHGYDPVGASIRRNGQLSHVYERDIDDVEHPNQRPATTRPTERFPFECLLWALSGDVFQVQAWPVEQRVLEVNELIDARFAPGEALESENPAPPGSRCLRCFRSAERPTRLRLVRNGAVLCPDCTQWARNQLRPWSDDESASGTLWAANVGSGPQTSSGRASDGPRGGLRGSQRAVVDAQLVRESGLRVVHLEWLADKPHADVEWLTDPKEPTAGSPEPLYDEIRGPITRKRRREVLPLLMQSPFLDESQLRRAAVPRALPRNTRFVIGASGVVGGAALLTAVALILAAFQQGPDGGGLFWLGLACLAIFAVALWILLAVGSNAENQEDRQLSDLVRRHNSRIAVGEAKALREQADADRDAAQSRFESDLAEARRRRVVATILSLPDPLKVTTPQPRPRITKCARCERHRLAVVSCDFAPVITKPLSLCRDCNQMTAKALEDVASLP